MDYRLKYLKYKNKYLNLKIQSGGEGINNACIALYWKTKEHTFIYLIREKTGEWNTPGGLIDKGESSFNAAFREFWEETGKIFDLKAWANPTADPTNPLRKFHKYVFGGHTAIWWYVSYEDPKITFKANTEATDGGWFDISDLPTNLRYPKSVKELTGILWSIGLFS
jgi:8-oxo-dGTP pyrophosphatase MutT (NUDIX family)